MRIEKKLVLVLMAAMIVVFAASCMSTSKSQYMPLSNSETVIGSVQATFAVHSSLFFLQSTQDAVNKDSYIHLMQEAGRRYPGNIDIRDIEWVTGQSLDNQNVEISANGKVVRME